MYLEIRHKSCVLATA